MGHGVMASVTGRGSRANAKFTVVANTGVLVRSLVFPGRQSRLTGAGSPAFYRDNATACIAGNDDAAQLQHSPRVQGNEGVADLFGGGWCRGFDRSPLAEPSFVRSVAHGKGRETGAKGENEDWFHRGMG